MRFSNTIACLAAFLVAPTAAASLFGVSPNDSLKVPGESPLEFCNAERDHDLITIDKVDLSPNPPKAGQALIITASGTINKVVRKGAYVKLVVKYGLIQLLSTTADLCEQLGNVDLTCPLEKGKLTITKSVDLPSAIPPGVYNVVADVYSDDDEHITCLKASVNFPRPGFLSSEETEEL